MSYTSRYTETIEEVDANDNGVPAHPKDVILHTVISNSFLASW